MRGCDCGGRALLDKEFIVFGLLLNDLNVDRLVVHIYLWLLLLGCLLVLRGLVLGRGRVGVRRWGCLRVRLRALSCVQIELVRGRLEIGRQKGVLTCGGRCGRLDHHLDGLVQLGRCALTHRRNEEVEG